MDFWKRFSTLPFLEKDSPIKKSTVLVRVDFNVPIEGDKISNDYRLQETLPTLRFLLQRQNKLILLSHLGRPKSAANPWKLTLKPVFLHLQKLLPDIPLFFAKENSSVHLVEKIAQLPLGSILLLENSRFQDLPANKESGNSPALAQFWASLAQYYVFDAFATAHRLHASTVGLLAHFPPSGLFLGFLVKKELLKYRQLLANTPPPFTVIVGGGKPASKLPLLGEILPKVDRLIVCGALSYTFWKAQGYEIGNNPIAESYLPTVLSWLKLYPNKLYLPTDFATTKSFANLPFTYKKIGHLAKDDCCLDLGPASLQTFLPLLASSQTVVWNGPPGIFEWSHFIKGTKTIMAKLKELAPQTKIILGGGDSVAAANQFGIDYHDFSHVSTGGGAFLLLLAKNRLPFLDHFLLALQKKRV